MTLNDFSIQVAPTIQAITSAFGLLSLAMLWWQVRKTNDWNRVGATFQIMETEKFSELEKRAIDACSAIQIPFPKNLDREESVKVRSDQTAYHSIKSLMMFLDRICVAYQAGYIDRDIIFCTYGPIIVGYYRHLSTYIGVVRDEMSAPEAYRDFTQVAADLDERIKRHRKLAKMKERYLARILGTPVKL